MPSVSSQNVVVMRCVLACIIFQDASDIGYCKQFANEDGKVHCFLLTCKSRVTLLNFASISQLELDASILSLKISQQLKQELEIEGDISEKGDFF